MTNQILKIKTFVTLFFVCFSVLAQEENQLQAILDFQEGEYKYWKISSDGSCTQDGTVNIARFNDEEGKLKGIDTEKLKYYPKSVTAYGYYFSKTNVCFTKGGDRMVRMNDKLYIYEVNSSGEFMRALAMVGGNKAGKYKNEFEKIKENNLLINQRLSELKKEFELETRLKKPSAYYTKVFEESEGYKVVHYFHKYGCLNAKNEEVIPCVHKKLTSVLGGMLIEEIDKKFTILNISGEVVISELDHAYYEKQLKKYIISKGSDHGYVEADGKIDWFLKNSDFDQVTYFSKGFKTKKGNKYGVVSFDGAVVIPTIFSKISMHKEQFYRVDNGKTSGFFDLNGLMIFNESEYSYYEKNLKKWIVSKNRSHAFITDDGNVEWFLKDTEYDQIAYKKEYYLTRKGKKFGKVALDGTEILPPICDQFYPFKDGILVIKYNGWYGMFAEGRGYITEAVYGAIYTDGNEVKLYGNQGVVDDSGNITWDEGVTAGILSDEPVAAWRAEYDRTLYLTKGGLTEVSKDGNWGFVDEDGMLAIPLMFENITCGFKNGVAGVSYKGKSGFIDETGRFIVPCEYEVAPRIFDNEMIALKGTKCYHFDFEGNLIKTTDRNSTSSASESSTSTAGNTSLNTVSSGLFGLENDTKDQVYCWISTGGSNWIIMGSTETYNCSLGTKISFSDRNDSEYKEFGFEVTKEMCGKTVKISSYR